MGEHDFIHRKWNSIMNSIMNAGTIPSCLSGQPVLHAALMKYAPDSIIRDIISRDECRSMITIQDSMGRYPLDVALERGLRWNDEDGILKQILFLFTNSDARFTAINLAARHGLQWENGMKKIVERTKCEFLNEFDELTGSLPFALAAAGRNCNLDAIYELMRKKPQIYYLYE